tara:strand:+ start:1028 stop:1141 length:114 start_codon:yes stop_codon:yes gene_type:complete
MLMNYKMFPNQIYELQKKNFCKFIKNQKNLQIKKKFI